MGIDLGDEEGGGDPADEIYTAGKPIFQEIGQACVKTAIGGAFVVLACRWRWARALLWLESVALLVVPPAKGRQRALFGRLLGVNLVILAGTYAAPPRALEGVRGSACSASSTRTSPRSPARTTGPRSRRGRSSRSRSRFGLLAWWHRAPYGATRRARVRAVLDPRHAHLLLDGGRPREGDRRAEDRQVCGHPEAHHRRRRAEMFARRSAPARDAAPLYRCKGVHARVL